jgi:general stress protein 26
MPEDSTVEDSTVVDRIWSFADRMDPCMLITRDGDEACVRPVYARVRRDEGRIYILTDTSGGKLDQIAARPQVTLAFSDPRANDYVVISGSATVSRDREKIAEVWRASDASFWESADNPDLRLIAVEPRDAELWDGSNLLVSGAKILAERLVGVKAQLVENAKVERI